MKLTLQTSQGADSLEGTVTLTATPSPTPQTTHVQFYVDSVLVATDTSAPFTYSWDTTTVDDGSHLLRALSFYPRNRMSEAKLTVTVLNTAEEPPPPPIEAVPVNTTLPAISGTATQGQTLTVSEGVWTNTPISYSRQWVRCDSGGANCVLIASATGATYTLTAADVGATIRCSVTAFNIVGSSAPVQTAQTAVVAALAGAVPVIVTSPAISGTAIQGSSLSVSNGVWSGSPTSYAREWFRCDAAGAACVEVAGQTLAVYALTSADIGKTIRAEVTATNQTGASTPAQTAQTAVIAALPPPPPPPPPPTGTIRPATPGQANAVINECVVGDTVLLRGGVHPQLTLSRSFSGGSITVKCEPGSYVSGIHTNGHDGYVFDTIESRRPFSSNIDDSCFYIYGTSDRIQLLRSVLRGSCITVKVYCPAPAFATNIVVKDNDVSGGHDCIHVNGAQDMNIEHNYLHDNNVIPGGHHDGVQVTRGDRIQIVRNHIKNTALVSDSQGILIGEPGVSLTNVVIANNLVAPLGATGGTGIMVCNSTNVIVVNNTCADTTKHGFNVQPVHGPIVNCQVWNNIFQTVFFDAPYNVVGGNMAFYDTNWIIDQSSGSTGNRLGTNPKGPGAPGFVDSVNYDLTAGAAARNFGLLRSGTPTVDRTGAVRPTSAPVGLGCMI